MATKKATSDTAAADQGPTASTDAPPKPKRKKRRARKKVAAAMTAVKKTVVVKRKKKGKKGRRTAGGPNKSKAIRNYLAAHKGAGPTEVAAALKKEGIDVTPAFVSNIKSKSKLIRSTRKVKRGRPVGSGGGGVSRVESISMSALLEAKKLAEQVGGIDKAAEAVAALKRLL
jgi:hypothetical protein